MLPAVAGLVEEGLLEGDLAVQEWVEVLEMVKKMEDYKLVTNAEDQIISPETVMPRASNAMLAENLKAISYDSLFCLSSNFQSRDCPYAAQTSSTDAAAASVSQPTVES